MMKITTDNELCDYIESLQYDRNALADLLCMAAQRGIQDSDAYKSWQRDYIEKSREYETARGVLVGRFVIPAAGDANVIWNLDFQTATLTIRRREEKCNEKSE